ncbi:t-SNARE [Schizopora paradoxa]|uniref:t-SNARE n=1 Tax=Schizopora paradoxa TaxID=27342 RepID=A0A0H2SFV0_9AGAM|nr:t-SNARE [Schizopora paradoxa]
MPVQDRTVEFKACVDSIRNRSPAPSRLQAEAKQRLLQNGEREVRKSDFSRMAGAIGRDISSTTIKLGKLAQLAKRKTLFDDRPVEISELSSIIKQDIAKINHQIAALKAHLGGAQQQSKGTSAEKQINEHNNNVLMLLQTKLADTSVGFKDVLELRTQNLKESKERTDQFISSTAAAVRQTPQNSLLFGGQGKRDPMGDGSARDVKGKGRALPDNDMLALDLDAAEGGFGGQSQQMQLVEQQDTYIQSRATAIESIESTIAELGQIFSQLATMVAEQRETVQRIDADTIDIAENVSGAQRELLKYYASISSNRWLMLKVFGVLIVFFLVFILVS